MIRAFVSIRPPEDALQPLVAAQAGLPVGRLVAPENLHLTLAFLGDVDAAAVAPLAEALRARAAGVPGFTARLAGAGAFPPHGPVRVIWAGLEPEADLARLAAAVRAAVGDAGLAADDKPFRAHLTLARCPEPWRAEARAALAGLLGPLEGTLLPAERIALIESVLGPAGPTYRELVQVALGAAG